MTESERLKEQFADDIAKLAILQYENEEAVRLDELDEQLKRDPAYTPAPMNKKQLQKVDKALRRERRCHWCEAAHLHRRAIVRAAICLVIALSVTAVAFGDSFANLLINMGEQYLSRTHGQPEIHYISYSGLYVPAYVPEGYAVTRTIGEHGLSILIYEGTSQDETIQFEQNDNGVCQYLDSEHAKEISDLVIQGGPGKRLRYADGKTVLVWGEHPYYLLSSSTVPEAELLKMAESVTYVP